MSRQDDLLVHAAPLRFDLAPGGQGGLPRAAASNRLARGARGVELVPFDRGDVAVVDPARDGLEKDRAKGLEALAGDACLGERVEGARARAREGEQRFGGDRARGRPV